MPKVEEEVQEGLLDFNWENDGEDFFNISAPAKEEEEPKEKEEELETEDEDKTKSKETEETKEDVDSFFDEEIEEESEKIKAKEVTSSETFYTDVYKDLKENGIFKHVELEEGEELDSEKLFEIQEQEYEAEVSARLKHWATEELDEDAQAFISFKKNGGTTSEFFKSYSSSSNLPVGDIKEEIHQDKVIRYQLKAEGWDSDEIEDRIQYLTESGKKEVVAKRYDAKIQEDSKEERKEVLRQAEIQKEAQKKQETTFKTNIKEALDKTKEVSGVKITPKDKTELYSFLTKKQHRIGDSKSITGFQKKLGEVFQDTEKMLLLAKLVNNDFNMKDFEKATITKKTRQIKSNLEQRKNLRPTNSGSSLEGNSLAELFN